MVHTAGVVICSKSSDKNIKTINTEYTYDAQGNVLSKDNRGNSNGGVKELFHYTYDALNRLTSAIGQFGNTRHFYTYDSLGNLTREQTDNNKYVIYTYNIMNQQAEKLVDGQDRYTMTYDRRGNLIGEFYHHNSRNHSRYTAQYEYDAVGKLVMGKSYVGTSVDYEYSEYIYNALGDLVGNIMTIENHNHGYHGIQSDPDAPSNSKTAVVEKKYVIDYTSDLRNILVEYETNGLTYRYTYGALGRKLSVTISPVLTSAGELVNVDNEVKLYYHHDRLGSTKFLTDDVSGKVVSYVDYDEWGATTDKAVLRLGLRQLDLVTSYTGYIHDPVLDIYYAQARMYDANSKRFLAIDPWEGELTDPQTLAKYTYVINNPLKYIDPFGLTQTGVSGASSAGGTTDTTDTSNTSDRCDRCKKKTCICDEIDSAIEEAVRDLINDLELDKKAAEELDKLIEEISGKIFDEIIEAYDKFEDAGFCPAEEDGLFGDMLSAFIDAAVEIAYYHDGTDEELKEILDTVAEAILDTAIVVENLNYGNTYRGYESFIKKFTFRESIGDVINLYLNISESIYTPRGDQRFINEVSVILQVQVSGIPYPKDWDFNDKFAFAYRYLNELDEIFEYIGKNYYTTDKRVDFDTAHKAEKDFLFLTDFSLAIHLTLEQRFDVRDLLVEDRGYLNSTISYLEEAGFNNKKEWINPFKLTEARALALKASNTHTAAEMGMTYHDWYTFLAVVSIFDGAARMGHVSGTLNDLQKNFQASQSAKAINVAHDAAVRNTANGAQNTQVQGAGSATAPSYPGNNPNIPPRAGFEWRGSGPVGSSQGNWYNPLTKEWMRPDLNHAPPIGPHWDYGIKGQSPHYRIFPDGSMIPK